MLFNFFRIAVWYAHWEASCLGGRKINKQQHNTSEWMHEKKPIGLNRMYWKSEKTQIKFNDIEVIAQTNVC
jgi:hypothetical protein